MFGEILFIQIRHNIIIQELSFLAADRQAPVRDSWDASAIEDSKLTIASDPNANIDRTPHQVSKNILHLHTVIILWPYILWPYILWL